MRAAMRALASLAMSGLFLIGSAAAIDRAPDRIALAYEIERKGDVVGRHEILLTDQGNGISHIDIETKIRVKIGFLTAFRLDHQATEIWNGSHLDSMTSFTKRGRKEEHVSVRSRESGFEVDVGSDVALAPSDLVPSSFTKPDFWIAHGERDFTLLDTLTGLMRPSVLLCGERSQLRRGDLVHDVTYYSIRDLENDRLSHEFWIDDEGYLIEGLLHTKDGETLLYRMKAA